MGDLESAGEESTSAKAIRSEVAREGNSEGSGVADVDGGIPDATGLAGEQVRGSATCERVGKQEEELMRKQLGRTQRKALEALDYDARTVDQIAQLSGLSRRDADRCTMSLARAGYAVRKRGARNRVIVSVTEAGLDMLAGV